MYLKKIEIQGFKSFADPVAIEVGDGLTCIIGPNGSGKSNISDAMRWVLGEQSAKTLRGGKMEEIIFAGTDSRRAKSMAEVTLVFDNSSRFLDIDYSEVSIRRRLYRSGESEYFINSNQCRLRDIKDLIMDTGIGVDGYSFIGQGRVDRIVSDKPETRREVFEEAAGIIKYKTRRAEAERKLENAGTNLDRLNDIIIDIESRIDGLREESEKAKEYAELMERYRKLEINITLKNIENMQAKSDQLRDQNARSEAEIEGLKKDKASAEASLQSMRARDEELGRRGDRLRESITENVTKAMEISGEAAKSEERKRASDRDRKRLEEEIAALTAKIESESAVAAGLLENRKALTESMEALTAELAALTSLAAGKGDVYAATVSQIESMRTELFELSREKSVKEIEKDSIENLAENFDAAERRAKEEIAALETSASEISEKLKTVSEVALKKTKERELRSAESETLQSGYDEAVSGLADARAEAERTGLRIEKQASRMRTIEEMESNYEGYAQGVRSAMKAGISGLDGVVAELLQVEKGYEVAIETALGARLQNIICENDEAARKAIGYLKENKAGRLTFLPVTSVRGTVKESGLDAGAPGHLGSALGKVSYDSRYEGVFRYLLGRIVLADTLENAVRLAKKVAGGMSIVTVGGEVISPAGAMTGGTYRHKSANLLERRNEITGLREEIGTLKKRGGELAALISDLDSKASGLLAAIRENDAGRRQAEAEAIRAESEQEQTAAREDELRSAAEKVRKELEDVILERQNSVELISALDMALTKISGDMARLEAEADRASEGVDALKGESETATERVTEIRLKAAETGVAKQNMDQAWDAADMAIADLKAQLSGKESELASIEVEVGSLSAEEAMSALAALERDKAKFTAELEAVTSEKNGLKISVEESDLEAHRLAERLEAAIGHKFGMETELARQDTRVTTWKEKLFDEFEMSYAHALEYREQEFVMSRALSENRTIKDRLREIGEVNPGSVRDYEETSERYGFLTAQRDDVLRSMSDFDEIVRDMDKISREKFSVAFDMIAESFSGIFSLLFGGGKGEVLLENDGDPLNCGIEIRVRPPGKTNLASIDSYSGGEKAMIAICLMFAILKARPTPFCILDEVDAALDESNIHRFAKYIEGFEGTQFAVVTHQRQTMEYADTLFGVTMQEEGVTSILSLALGDKKTEEFTDALQ